MPKSKVVIKVNRDKTEAKKVVSEPKMVTEWYVGRIAAAISLLLLIPVIAYFLISYEDGNRNISAEVSRQQNAAVNKLSVKESIKETNMAVSRQVIKPVEQKNPEKENAEPIRQEEEKVAISIETVKPPEEDKDKSIAVEQEKVNQQKLISDKDNKIEPIDKDKIEKPAIVKKQPDSKIFDRRVSRALLAGGINKKEPFNLILSPVVSDRDKAISLFYFTEIQDMKGQVLFHHWLRNGKTVFKRKLNILGNHWRAATSKNITFSKKGRWQVKLVDGDGNIMNVINFDVI